MKIARAKKDEIEMMIEARIAQPIDSIVRPSDVNPSMVNMSAPICVESHATNKRSAPLITKEIRPKVRT